jgi:3'-5' exoribonuclease
VKKLHVTDLAQQEGRVITDYFLVQSKDTRATRDGKPYLALKLSDRTGQIEARVWDVNTDIEEFAADDLVKVEGQVDVYRGQTQLKVRRIRRVRDGEAELADFQPATREDVEALYEELVNIARSVNREPLQALLLAVLTDEELVPRLKRAPGGKKIHHAVLGGLLEHIVSLCRLCRLTAENYPDVDLDLLLTGAILHDVGKVQELSYERGFDYTTEGKLVGHINLGLEFLNRKMDEIAGFPHPLRLLVQHMILSHHGRLEFGSPVTPRFREAIMLHYLDDLDSKLAAVRAELEGAEATGKEGEWTDWNRALERPLLRQERFLEEALEEAPPAEELFAHEPEPARKKKKR